jgi:hypothetical protein
VEYFVKRGEERYGPYSLSDLQRYVQSGNIASDDLAQSEGMSDWVPVSQVLGNIPASAVTSGGAAAAPAPEQAQVPLPPNLHWSLVLLLGIVTFELFNLAWAVVQANWARRLSGNNKSLVLVIMYPAGVITGLLITLLSTDIASLGGIFNLAGRIAYIIGIFSIRSAMEDYYSSGYSNPTENIGLRLSGVMTFFFSTVYLQYHINRISRWKKTGLLT